MKTMTTLASLEAAAPAAPNDAAIIAALDIGTNSVRMALVRLDEATGTWTFLSQHKETVRLGQDEFAHNRLSLSLIHI